MLSAQDRKTIKTIDSFIFSHIDNRENYYFKEGYKNFGILLVGFCKWVHDQNEKNKAKIFFFSRDGYIVKQAYKILYPREETNYFYVSRRSLALPSMKDAKSVEDIIDSLVLPPIFSIDVLLEALNIDSKRVKSELKKLDINKEDKFKRSTIKENQKILEILRAFFDEIVVNAKNQYHVFSKYLVQEQFEGEVAIIDIGWHNSLQKQIIKMMDDNITIRGYYVGVYKNAHHFSSKNTAMGYMYSYGNKMNNQFKTFSFVSLFETMFLAHEGTTIGYKEEKGKVIPLLSPYEYQKEKNSLYIVENFQKGALKFVEDYKDNNLSIRLNSNICSYKILKFGSHPTKKSIEMFENISFENYKVHNIINYNKKSLYYFLHPKEMVKDFYTSGWRVAFLKKLFKVPFPYYYFVKILCIIFKGEQ